MSVLQSLAYAMRQDPGARHRASAGALSQALGDINSRKRIKAFGSDLLGMVQNPEMELDGNTVMSLVHKHELRPEEAQYAVGLLKESQAWDAAVRARKAAQTKLGDVIGPQGVNLDATAEQLNQFGPRGAGVLTPMLTPGKRNLQVLKPGEIYVDEAGNEIARGAEVPGTEPKTHVLSPGQRLYDSSGKMIAAVPESASGIKEKKNIIGEMKEIGTALKDLTGDSVFAFGSIEDLTKDQKENMIERAVNLAETSPIPAVKSAAQRYLELGKEIGWFKDEPEKKPAVPDWRQYR